jgi:hypothetical protein
MGGAIQIAHRVVFEGCRFGLERSQLEPFKVGCGVEFVSAAKTLSVSLRRPPLGTPVIGGIKFEAAVSSSD